VAAIATTTALGTEGVLRRVWRLPLGCHVAALALVLVALMGVVGTNASFSADEGAAIIQARQLSRGDGWTTPNPLPEVDPEGDAFPLQYSDRGEKGFAPFAKHPVYPLLLAGADRIAGVPAMVLLSMVGTLVAATLAAALAGHLAPGLRRPTLWTTGVASPLLFDGYMVIAHTLAAALVTGALLLVLRTWRTGRLLPVLGTAACLAGAILLRTEALLFGMALAVATGAYGVLRRNAPAVIAAAAAAGASVVTVRVEHAMTHAIVGPALSLNAAINPSVSRDPLRGFVTTWLRPSQGGHQVGDLFLFVMMGTLLAAALSARRRPAEGAGITLLAVVAASAAVVRVFVDSPDAVPGLLVAFPIFWAGLWLLDRRTFAGIPGGLTGATVVLFFVAVAASQYERGGSGEWGGRYFALGLPLAVPLVLDGYRRFADRVDVRTRTVVVGALVACSLALTVLAVRTLDNDHHASESVVAAVDRAAGRDVPVILTTEAVLPRSAWRTFDRQRWLLVDAERLADYARRLRQAGIDRVTFATRERLRTEPILNRVYETADSVGASDGSGWQVLTLQAR
jgi:hypothetical protein